NDDCCSDFPASSFFSGGASAGLSACSISIYAGLHSLPNWLASTGSGRPVGRGAAVSAGPAAAFRCDSCLVSAAPFCLRSAAAGLSDTAALRKIKRPLFFVIARRFLYVSRIMTDPRYSKLAKLLVEYSTALKQGDRILVDMIDVPDEFTVELVRA